MTGRAEKSLMCNADVQGFVQGYEEMKWGINKPITFGICFWACLCWAKH